MRMKALVLVVVTLILAAGAGATDSVLYNFCSQTSCVDGYVPYGSLVADSSGDHLYGTTYQGGTNNFGEVFELTNSGGTWSQTVIYSFLGASNSDGAYPYSGLVFDASGKKLYGTTLQGGPSSQGTVFELSNSGGTWKETVLHSFDDISGSDGYYPYDALVLDAAGNLYGTTQSGGKFGGGTVFELKASNGKFNYKVIQNFATSGSLAYSPYGALVVDPKNGYLYGTTYYGGTVWNAGAVYQMRQISGVWLFSVIYNFLGDSLGQNSESGLAVDANGNLYGTTYTGGDLNLGAVFKLTLANKKWTQKIIYSFKGYAKKDGAYPYFAGVTLDAQGNVYGTTYQGGSSPANNLNYGTVYKLTAGTYKESVLWSFGTSGDGYSPYHPAILVNGKLYGTTNSGGSHGGGVVYEVAP